MGLDLRWPIGLMFSLLGIILTLTGLFTGSNHEMYKRSLDININFWWGLVLLAFGAFMLFMARKGAKEAAASQPAASDKPAGGPGVPPR
jgi:hypothetical protein